LHILLETDLQSNYKAFCPVSQYACKHYLNNEKFVAVFTVKRQNKNIIFASSFAKVLQNRQKFGKV